VRNGLINHRSWVRTQAHTISNSRQAIFCDVNLYIFCIRRKLGRTTKPLFQPLRNVRYDSVVVPYWAWFLTFLSLSLRTTRVKHLLKF